MLPRSLTMSCLSCRPLSLGLAVALACALLHAARLQSQLEAQSSLRAASHPVPAPPVQLHSAVPPLLADAGADLQRRHLGGRVADDSHPTQRCLLAIAVGDAQLDAVDACVRRFSPVDWAVILFHYDTFDLSLYAELPWAREAIHVSGASPRVRWPGSDHTLTGS